MKTRNITMQSGRKADGATMITRQHTRSLAGKALAFLLLAAGLCAVGTVHGADNNPPERMTYQGFLTDGAGDPLGMTEPTNYEVQFEIYNTESAGIVLWAEQQVVVVDEGNFSVLLGEGVAITNGPHNDLSTIFKPEAAANKKVSDRFLQMNAFIDGNWVNILPRLRLLSSPYALLSKNAITVVDSADGSQLVSGSSGVLTLDGNVNVTGDISLSAGKKLTGKVVATSDSDLAGKGTIPLGGIIMWSGTSAPTGWALCNGSNGTPDLRGRFIVGYHPSVGDYNQPGNRSTGGSTAGDQGGSASVTLTTAQMPQHDHDAYTRAGDGGHWHYRTVDRSENNDGGDGRIDFDREGDDADFSLNLNSSADGTHQHLVDTPTKGSSSAHENRPPYYTLAFIMRIQ